MKLNGIITAILALFLATKLEARTEFLKFTGGPTGGTFQLFSNSLASYLTKSLDKTKVSNQGSAGSTENLRKLNRGRAHFGVVHSGDLYLGRKGQLSGDTKTYKNVFAMAVLYRSAAQLAVLDSSKIRKLSDLTGKKVGIGGPGSGAAATAQRYFSKIGMWDKIQPQYLGYSKAAAAMKDGHLDAMWVVSGFPTRAIIELSATKKVRLLDLSPDGEAKGFFAEYPFYQKLDISAKTYEGINSPLKTFADSTVWVASKKASSEKVYQALKSVYSAKGLSQLQKTIPSANYMAKETGTPGIKVPFHPGAVKYWQEVGINISKDLR